MKAVLPAFARSMVEAELPADIDVAWFTTPDEANAMVVDADIAWVDMQQARYAGEPAARGTQLNWLSTIFAGPTPFPLPLLAVQGMLDPTKSSLKAIPVTVYDVLGNTVSPTRHAMDH